jgi:hypothetical protein
MALLRDILLEKYKDKLPPPILPEDMMSEIDCLFPPHLAEFLEARENKVAVEALNDKAIEFRAATCIQQRDESEAFEAAIEDLIRLDRYERRAWSRQKRAMLAFMNLKLTKHDEPGKAAN